MICTWTRKNVLQCSQDSYKIWLNCLPTITGDFHSDVNFVLKMAFSANWLSRCIHIDNVVKHRKVFKYVCLQVFFGGCVFKTTETGCLRVKWVCTSNRKLNISRTLFTRLQEDRFIISLGIEQTPTGDFQSDVNFVSKLPFMSTNSVDAFKLIHNKSAWIQSAKKDGQRF